MLGSGNHVFKKIRMKKCLAIILLNIVMEVLPYIIVNKHAYIRKEKTKLSLSVMICLRRKQSVLIIYKSLYNPS